MDQLEPEELLEALSHLLSAQGPSKDVKFELDNLCEDPGEWKRLQNNRAFKALWEAINIEIVAATYSLKQATTMMQVARLQGQLMALETIHRIPGEVLKDLQPSELEEPENADY